MSFGVQQVKESRIQRERKPRVNLCSCGKEVDSTELLCHACYMEIHGYDQNTNEGCEIETEVASR